MTPDDFTPCVLALQRDPNIIEQEKLEQVVHLWNRDVREHVQEDLIKQTGSLPIPLATVKQMEELNDDFLAPDGPVWCDVCFDEEP